MKEMVINLNKDDKRTVLFIYRGLPTGGIETFIMNIYRTIDRKKIQFDFLIHTYEKCHYDD